MSALNNKFIHFLGIGGSGASAIAAIAQAQGYKVTGCDKVPPFNEFTRSFDFKDLYTGHSKHHLIGADALIVTPAVFSLDPDNEELIEAKDRGIPVMTWQEFMGKTLEKDKYVIAVCGTHGKSTTTAMVGKLLEDGNLDPTVELGAITPTWQTNYRIGESKYFVTEADEFNDNFLNSTPDIAIVTTIEMDHPEYFKNFKAYKGSFKKFLGSVKEKIIANLSDPGVKEVVKEGSFQAEVIDYSQQMVDCNLAVPGHHNRLNASAAYQVGLALGLDKEIIKKSLGEFGGIGRRFEYLGNYQGIQIFSDFAHHPTEIRVTMEAAREKFPGETIWMVFQPHMFSRTYALFDDFVKVLKAAPVDKILLMDIYPSREVYTSLVNSGQLAEAVGEIVTLTKDGQAVLDYLESSNEKPEVIFFTGAGSTDQLAKKLLGQDG